MTMACFNSSSKYCVLIGYSDSDCVGYIDDHISTFRYCFIFGGTACSWSSKIQSIVTISTCDAEYVATAPSVCQVIYLHNLINQIYVPRERPIKISIDNISTINLAKKLITHGMSKHIDTCFHFLRNQVNKKKLSWSTASQKIKWLTSLLNL